MNDDSDTRLTRRGSSHEVPEKRREQLLAAAIRCFGKTGYYGTTMDAVAVDAGLSKGSLYRFFKSKDELLLAILDEFVSEIDRQILANALETGVLRQIFNMCRTSIEFMSGQQQLLSVWFEFFHHDVGKVRMQEIYAKNRQELGELIKAGVESGEIAPTSVQGAVDAILAFVEGLLILAHIETSFDLQERLEVSWPVLEAGLKHGAPR